MKFLSKIWRRWHLTIVLALVTLALTLNAWALSRYFSAKPESESVAPVPVISTPTVVSTVSASNVSSSEQPQFGHFPYAEGDFEKMYVIGSYALNEDQRFERLLPEAALALMKLISAARYDGVWIFPVSGFRSVEKQKELFKAQIQKRGSVELAAKISAPPGYSEHHTGYALDLTDGQFPRKDVTYDFPETAAFRWLKLHAKEFGFEMSFPDGNSQGISYEPWHWRYIGSPEASAIFKQARQ